MKHSKLLFAALFFSSIFLVLSASIAAPLLLRPFYYAHVSLLNLPQQTGWSAAQICHAYNEMMNYCILGTPFGTGDLLWSESGMQHFRDCAILFRIDFIVLVLSSLSLGCCLHLHRRGWSAARFRGFGPFFCGGVALAVLFLLIGGLAALNFDRAFLLFHELFFPGKENWLFDARTDQIILILPQVFFRNCALLVLFLLFGACTALTFLDRRRIP